MKIKFRAWNIKRFLNSDEFAVLPNGELLVYDYGLEKWTDAMYLNIDLMQYTGLKDKNGVEIYEGDLVAVADYANWEGLYKIIWDEKNLMYMLEDAFGDREKLCEFEEYLVKGNIYENPELLEVEE